MEEEFEEFDEEDEEDEEEAPLKEAKAEKRGRPKKEDVKKNEEISADEAVPAQASESNIKYVAVPRVVSIESMLNEIYDGQTEIKQMLSSLMEKTSK